jgi:hypothetical protein
MLGGSLRVSLSKFEKMGPLAWERPIEPGFFSHFRQANGLASLLEFVYREVLDIGRSDDVILEVPRENT